MVSILANNNGEAACTEVRAGPAAEEGFSLIEVIITGFVVVIAFLGLAGTMAAGGQAQESARQELRVRNAIRGVLAEITETSFAQITAHHNKRGFDVAPLEAPKDDPDGRVGLVTVVPGPDTGTALHEVTIVARWRGVTGVRSVKSVHLIGDARGEA